MAKIDSVLLEIEDLTKNANLVKNMLLAKMANENIISDEKFIELSDEWHVIIVKNGWFKTLFKKVTSNPEDYSFKIVKFDDTKCFTEKNTNEEKGKTGVEEE